MKKSDITKEKILISAEKAFAEKGLYGARVDEIAESAGVNKRMIYAHYESKENLYITIIDKVYKRMADEESALINEHMDCVEAVNKIIEHYFHFLSENPAFVKIVMWENLNMGQFFDSMNMSDSRNPIKNALHSILARGQSQGVFRESIDEKQFLMTLFACPFNYFSNQYTMRRIMGSELTDASEIENRISFTSELLLAYLKK